MLAKAKVKLGKNLSGRLALSVKACGFASSPKGRARGLTAASCLSLWERCPRRGRRGRGRCGQNLSAVPALALFFCRSVCYNKNAALLHSILWRKEVRPMREILSFVLSVAAGVVANYVYKWLDEQDKDGKH